MDVAEVYVRSPPIKAEPRWGREDTMDRNPMNDGYRRRSPGKQELSGNATLFYPSPYLKLLIPSSTSTYPIYSFSTLHHFSRTQRHGASVLILTSGSEQPPALLCPICEVG